MVIHDVIGIGFLVWARVRPVVVPDHPTQEPQDDAG